MKRTSADGAINVVITDDPDAPKVFLKEEDFKARYPWDYAKLTEKLRKRYSDFKATDRYHKIRKGLMGNSMYSMSRLLDPGNPKSAKKDFFSASVLDEFDKAYTLWNGGA
jgi:hypothetical protein